MVHFPDLFLVKLTSLTVASGGLSPALQTSTSASLNVWQTVISVAVATTVPIVVLLLKQRYDRKRTAAANLLATRREDGMTSIEREKILDGRVDTLFEESKEFYALRDREKESIIALLKDALARANTLSEQQRELITQQAANIQQLMPKL